MFEGQTKFENTAREETKSPESGNPAEIHTDPPAPGGEIASRLKETSRVRVDADGTWHETPLRLGVDGKWHLVNAGAESQPSSPTVSESSATPASETLRLSEPDRARLNRIVQDCSDPKALFGREAKLDEQDFEVIENVIERSQAIIDEAVRQLPDWSELQKQIQRSIDHGGFKPKVRDGGSIGASTLKINEGINEVVVPQETYHVWQWSEVVSDLKISLVFARTANGNSALSLAENLKKVAHLLKQQQQL